MLGSELPNVPENVSFAVSFVYSRLRRGREEGDVEVGKSKVGWLQDGEDCAVRWPHVRRGGPNRGTSEVRYPRGRDKGQGWQEAKTSLLLAKLSSAWGLSVRTRHGPPSSAQL